MARRAKSKSAHLAQRSSAFKIDSEFRVQFIQWKIMKHPQKKFRFETPKGNDHVLRGFQSLTLYVQIINEICSPNL